MNKRREKFLSRNPVLKKFTRNAIVNHYGVSEEEFEKLIEDGFIVENNEDMCENCFRPWNHEQEECMYCGEEEYVKEVGYYRYK